MVTGYLVGSRLDKSAGFILCVRFFVSVVYGKTRSCACECAYTLPRSLGEGVEELGENGFIVFLKVLGEKRLPASCLRYWKKRLHRFARGVG